MINIPSTNRSTIGLELSVRAEEQGGDHDSSISNSSSSDLTDADCLPRAYSLRPHCDSLHSVSVPLDESPVAKKPRTRTKGKVGRGRPRKGEMPHKTKQQVQEAVDVSLACRTSSSDLTGCNRNAIPSQAIEVMFHPSRLGTPTSHLDRQKL